MAHEIKIVSESELRDVVKLDISAVDVIEQAFVALTSGRVVMPPILSMDLQDVNGEVDVKTAYIPGVDGFAIKVSPGFFDNPKLGLPSLNGLMILFSSKTGMVEAVFLDNGYLTNIRTAAAGAVAARHLAPKIVDVAGAIGAGVQARLQLKAAHLVRPFKRALIWSPDAALNEECVNWLRGEIDVEIAIAKNAEALVRDCQLVVTTTPAREPVLKAEWLHPGLHVTCMGSDQSGKNEIDPAALKAADAYICDNVDQCKTSGELEAALAAGLWDKGTPAELGEIITGKFTGRQSHEDVTICDLTGTGAQDTAIATHVYGTLDAVGAKY